MVNIREVQQQKTKCSKIKTTWESLEKPKTPEEHDKNYQPNI